jgi:hypothetical protein
MNDWHAEVSQFAKLIEPWVPAYRRIVKTYFAVRVDKGWRLCAARCTFASDIDSDSPPLPTIATENLSAGIDVTPVDPEALRRYLSEIASAPFRFAAGGCEYDLSHGDNSNRGRVQFERVKHHVVVGTRRAPGLQITFAEDFTPRLPDERILDAEVQAGRHHFPTVRRLLAQLELNQNVLRLPVQPSIDVIAPAPGRVVADTSRSRRMSIAATASRSLDPESIDIKGTIIDQGTRHQLPLKRPLQWRPRSDGFILQFNVSRKHSEVSVALTYQGELLDSFATSAESSDAELSFTPWLTSSLGEHSGTQAGPQAAAEPNRTLTDRWIATLKNNRAIAVLCVLATVVVAASGLWQALPAALRDTIVVHAQMLERLLH